VPRTELQGPLSQKISHCGLGSDDLHGGAGNDWLAGGAGEDILAGGSGNDQMDGDYANGPADYSDENDPNWTDDDGADELIYDAWDMVDGMWGWARWTTGAVTHVNEGPYVGCCNYFG
jgi:hypothetical protein